MKKTILYLFLIFSCNAFGQFKNLGGPIFGQVENYVFDGNRIYVLSKYSIHYSDDEGQSWTFVKGSNNLGPLDKMSVDGDIIYASTSDDFYIKTLNKLFKYENGEWTHLSKYKSNIDYAFSSMMDIFSFSDTLVVFKGDSMFVSSDHGKTKFVKKKFKDLYWTHSILNFKGSHYYVNGPDIVKTNDFVKEEVIGSFGVSYNRLFRNENNIFLCRYSLHGKLFYILEGGEFKQIYSELIFGDILSNYRRDKFYYYGDTIYKNDGFYYKYSVDNAKSFQYQNWPEYIGYFANKKAFNKHNIYYTINGLLFTAEIKENKSSIKNITSNFSSVKLKFEVSEDKITFKKKDGMHNFESYPPSIYDTNENKWTRYKQLDTINYCNIIDENVFIYSPLNFLNTLVYCDSTGTIIDKRPVQYIVAVVNKLLYQLSFSYPYISIDKGKSWTTLDMTEGYYFEYFNGYYIVFNFTDIAFSKDGIDWKYYKIFENTNNTELYINAATISENGEVFVLGNDNKVYKYNTNNLSTEEIKLPIDTSQIKINVLNYFKGILVIGTEGSGIYTSTDLGKNWKSVKNGLNSNFITDIKFHNDKIYVGTYRDLYEIPFTTFSTINDIPKTNVQIFPNPATELLTISTDIDIYKVQIINMNGNVYKTYYNENRIDISELSRGVYLIKVELNDGNIALSKCIKM